MDNSEEKLRTSTVDSIDSQLTYLDPIQRGRIALAILPLLHLDMADREEAIHALNQFMCMGCGSSNPHCNCRNDE